MFNFTVIKIVNDPIINQLLLLIVFGLTISFIVSFSTSFNFRTYLSAFGKFLMTLNKPIMMLLMAIPEQLVLATLEPGLPIISRIFVSIAMYIIHFVWNGMVMKPEREYNELVWIIGTAIYALIAVGVKKETAIALIAADSVMTLTLRDLV